MEHQRPYACVTEFTTTHHELPRFTAASYLTYADCDSGPKVFHFVSSFDAHERHPALVIDSSHPFLERWETVLLPRIRPILVATGMWRCIEVFQTNNMLEYLPPPYCPVGILISLAPMALADQKMQEALEQTQGILKGDEQWAGLVKMEVRELPDGPWPVPDEGYDENW